MPTQLEIEMEMKRRRDSDYKLLTEKEMLDAIHRVVIKLDERLSNIERMMSGEPRRLRY